MSGSGALRRLATRFRWALFKRETVGADEMGNVYWRYLDKDKEGEEVERRMVKYAGALDPTTLPAEWHQWLHKARVDPPTEEDIRRGQHQRELFRQRVAALEVEDAKRRFQEQTGSTNSSGYVQQVSDGRQSQPPS